MVLNLFFLKQCPEAGGGLVPVYSPYSPSWQVGHLCGHLTDVCSEIWEDSFIQRVIVYVYKSYAYININS